MNEEMIKKLEYAISILKKHFSNTTSNISFQSTHQYYTSEEFEKLLEDIKKKNYDRSTVDPVILEYERNHKVHSNSREARESRVKFLVELLK